VSWVTAIWSAAAGASLAMALLHLLIWSQDRRLWANLCFALMVVGPLGLAVCELITMHAASPQEFGRAVLWANLTYSIGVVGSLCFVHFYFRSGSNWLLSLAIGLRVLVVLANFASGGMNLQFTDIHALKTISFLGEPVSVLGEWVPSPWALLGQVASLVQLAYVGDAAFRLWRTGSTESRRRATVVGGALALFTVLAAGQAGLITAAVLRLPFILSLPFLAMVLAMGSELSRDVVRKAQLGRELLESEQRLALATEAASLGIWCRYLPGNEIWANAKWRELFGFTRDEPLDFARILQRMHADDRERVLHGFASAIGGIGQYSSEYRVVIPGGSTRWLASRGHVELVDGRPALIRGASLDITARKLAEEAAQDLSGRLIHAQEAERMRLARELHDDVNQSLALLAIELDILGQKPPASSSQTSERMQGLAVQVKSLSTSVHRISQGLHPAKLQQLGLVAAVRGLCRELGTAHNIEIAFATHEMPRTLAEDIALCLYRVTQEALQNAIKHSGCTTARVELMANEDGISLEISDPGRGFDAEVATQTNRLGLVSMRERVRLVLGQISISSAEGQGTRIQVRVPLGA
jgi:PAS domain S-box-containing protein